MIQITDLHKKFGDNNVLCGINLTIENKKIVAILGPNGSGKTTLIKSILGMVVPNKGSILVDGKSVHGNFKYRYGIDYLPQIAHFPSNLKVKELIAMIKDLRQRPSDEDRLITIFGIAPFLEQKLITLSGGTKQKVNIVMAFMFDCPLIILDEPTNGLDPVAMIQLKKLIQEEKQKGKTFLISSHIMQFVEEVADEIIYLLEGQIYFKGSIKSLMAMTKQNDFEHAIAYITQQTNV